MRSKNQLPLAFFGDDAEKFAEQIFEDAGIQFIDGHCDGGLVVERDEQMKDGDDLLDAVRLIAEGKLAAVFAGNKLDLHAAAAIGKKLGAEFSHANGQPRNNLLQHDIHAVYDSVDDIHRILRDGVRPIQPQRNHADSIPARTFIFKS